MYVYIYTEKPGLHIQGLGSSAQYKEISTGLHIQGLGSSAQYTIQRNIHASA